MALSCAGTKGHCINCEVWHVFFLLAWDNNWEYMDLPIHPALLGQHFYTHFLPPPPFTKYLKGSSMKGLKLAINLEEFHVFVLSLHVWALSKLWVFHPRCLPDSRVLFLVQIPFSKTHLAERLYKHGLAMIRVLHGNLSCALSAGGFSQLCALVNIFLPPNPPNSKFLFLKCISYL